MSKSKKNTVAPEDIFDVYGVDAARLFVLSDSPPERDVQWTSGRRRGRLALRQPGLERVRQPAGRPAPPPTPDAKADELRALTHKLIKAVTEAIEQLPVQLRHRAAVRIPEPAEGNSRPRARRRRSWPPARRPCRPSPG